MTMNLADLWEAVADRLPTALALAHGADERSFAAFDDRAARLASALAAQGIGAGAKVALYLYNANEYLEATFAAMKLRAIPVNVNFRYLADELRYLLDNADAAALVYHGALADRVRGVRDALPRLQSLIQVTTTAADSVPLLPGAVAFEDLVRGHAPAARIPRSPDDLLLLYTGGTTGLPKGVMWRHQDLFRQFAAAYQALAEVPTSPAAAADAAAQLHAMGMSGPVLAAAPLMHGMAWFTSMSGLLVGRTVVSLTGRHFEADELWRTVQERRVQMCVIVGDAFARPMIASLEAAEQRGTPWDLSSLRMLVSGGVMWSAANKQPFLDRGVPLLIDGLGASEATGIGMQITTPGTDPTTARFQPAATTRVVTEDGRDVVPGSGEIGILLVGGAVPAGYYKDDRKTAATFREIDGVRYAIPGDWARVESDGSITLLGRGTVCINTGGEKVFPEEVEEALKLHPAVEDVVVVGVPDAHWGEVVTAVVAARPGAAPTAEELAAFTRQRLAAYKAPRQVLFVERVLRSPAGKPDYRWARSEAVARLSAGR